jgi:hypothetical protein
MICARRSAQIKNQLTDTDTRFSLTFGKHHRKVRHRIVPSPITLASHHLRLALQNGLSAQHSLTNVYANGAYVGSFQLSTSGPAFYYHAKEAGYRETEDIPLTWGQINDGLIMTYKTVFPWGPWICHDYTGYLFRTWGIKISNDSATASGPLYYGARVIGVVLWPGTAAGMAVHKGWNLAQDGARAASTGMQQLQDAFKNAARPGAWNWRIWK